MKKPVLVFFSFVLFFATILLAGSPSVQEQNYAKAITQLRLAVPEDAEARDYLGIKQKAGQIMLTDIDTDIIIVEVFNMYCPYCQRHAPTANKLYQAIESGMTTKGRVKFIGIGAGNTPYEVKFFKKKYDIPFPLFDDKDSALLNNLTGLRTPYYFGIRKNGKDLSVFFTQQGSYDDADDFLRTVVKKSGLNL
ncbi:MAG: peroxiredoxin family protein [Desulfomonilia bacterium]